MRAFGAGGRIAEVEARITAEMRAASAERWTIDSEAGDGDKDERRCCALGAVARDEIGLTPRLNIPRLIRQRLPIDLREYSNIASGFDGETFDPDTDEWVHLGRRLKVLGDELNAARGAA